MKILSILALFILINSCGSSPSRRVHEKQRTPSDVQISSLDFKHNNIELRFEYRTSVEKTLTSMDCDLILGEQPSIKLTKTTNIDLGAFSTEIIPFNLTSLPTNNHDKTIDYTLQCKATYNKGKEYMHKESTLHLVPSSVNKYR